MYNFLSRLVAAVFEPDEAVTDEDINKAFNEMNVDGDDKLNIDEFVKLLLDVMSDSSSSESEGEE